MKEIPFTDAFLKLKEVLEQGQFELLFTEEKIRLVYLMNDSVESFLVFKNARMTGCYRADYQGEIQAELNVEENSTREYVLIVHQGDTVVTLFFEDIMEEIYLYDYGEIGHFWVRGDEYLRQIEYKIAILRDKLDYLGADFCNETERKLAALADFPPLNYCCYPAVPEQYCVPRENPWLPSEAALQAMKELAAEAGDEKLLRILSIYQKFQWKWLAKKIARMLAECKHAPVVKLLMTKLKRAASEYSRRNFTEIEEERNRVLDECAFQRKRELEAEGRQVELFREEPFVMAQDSLQYKVYLMIWEKHGRRKENHIEEFSSIK